MNTPKVSQDIACRVEQMHVDNALDGIEEDPTLTALAAEMDAAGLTPEEQIKHIVKSHDLPEIIQRAGQEFVKRNNEDEAFEAARQEARKLFNEGKLAEASSALMEEFERNGHAERERQEERRGRQIRVLEAAIRFDELAFNRDAAAQKLRMIAELKGISGATAIGQYLVDEAHKFYERGYKKGENTALFVAIAAYRAALKELTRERVPLDWALTQNNLGNALQVLGERVSGTEKLNEAVAAYRAALEELPRERVSHDWAVTQNNLDNALKTLGERESGTGKL